MSLRTRLILYYLAISMLSILLVGKAVLLGIEHYTMKAVEKQLSQQTESALVYINQTMLLNKKDSSGLADLSTQLTNNLSVGNREVRIYDKMTSPLSASKDGLKQDVHSSEFKYFIKVLQPPLKNHNAYLIHDNKAYFTAPIEFQNTIIGILEFVYPLDFLKQVLGATRNILIAGAVLFAILIALLGIYTSNRIVKPIKHLVQAANRFAERDFTPIMMRRNDELGQLAASFSAMGSELQNYIDRQKQFVSNVSHELRTPLTAIKGYAEYLTEEAEGKPDMVKAVYHLNNETGRLQSMVDELLLLSRLDAERETFALTRLNLSRLVFDCLDKIQIRAGKFQVILRPLIKENVFVQGDQEKLTQAVINLLDNAIKYSMPDNEIKIYLLEEEQHAVLIIKDQGIGIPEQDMDKIFDRFTRASNAQIVGGTGLGLAICKEIVTAHHGTLVVKNREGGGTEVSFKMELVK